MVPHNSSCAKSKRHKNTKSPEILTTDRESADKLAWLRRSKWSISQRCLRPAVAVYTQPARGAVFASIPMLLSNRRAIHPQRQNQTTEFSKFYTFLYLASFLTVTGYTKRVLPSNLCKTYRLYDNVPSEQSANQLQHAGKV